MKRVSAPSLSVTVLTTLALLGSAEAGRRSGGGFGGSTRSPGSSSSSYRGPSAPSYRAPSPSRSAPPFSSPPANSSASSPYTRPRKVPPAPVTPAPKPNLSKPAPVQPPVTRKSPPAPAPQRTTTAAPNRAPTPQVTPSQLDAWKGARLPAGVPRRALTYSASPSGPYRYQLEKGRYYPYPQSYYRQHGIGYDLLKYALIFTAVSSVADALDGPDVVNDVRGEDFGNELQGVGYAGTVTPAPVPAGPNLWTYVGVGFLAAAAGWFILGRKRR